MDIGATGAQALPRYAEPRPAMRGRYLIRNPRAASALAVVDALLALRYGNAARPAAPAQPRRILIATWLHLGDILLALPTLRVLRSAFPAAEIGFVAGSWAQPVLGGTGLCDRLHVIDHFRMVRAAGTRFDKIRRYRAQRRTVLAELRALGYDVGIDLNAYFPPASPLFRAAGIPVRAGFTSGGFGPLLTHPVHWVQAPRPVSDYPRDLLAALWPTLKLPEDAFAPCYPGQPRGPLPAELGTGPYIVLHMGTGSPTREWPEENWALVAHALVARGHRIVLAGAGQREAARIGRLTAALPAPLAITAVDQPWATYVGIIARAAHLVCLESSSAHIAAAFRVPTTAIYPGLNDIVQWGPWNANARVLTTPVGCAPCYRKAGCEAMACIRGVSAHQVIDAVTTALGTVSRAS